MPDAVSTSTWRSTPLATPTATSPETERTCSVPSPRASTRTFPDTFFTWAPGASSPRRTSPDVALTSTRLPAAPNSRLPDVAENTAAPATLEQRRSPETV